MTSRQRVLAALAHQEADRVPIDCNGHRSSGMAVQTYKRLREYLGMKPGNLYVYDVIQQLAVIEDDMLDVLGVDVVQLGCEAYQDDAYWKEWKLHDGTEIKIPAFVQITKTAAGDYEIRDRQNHQLCIQKQGCLYFEQTRFPYLESDEMEFEDLEEKLEQIMWVKIGTPPAPLGLCGQDLALRAQQAKALRARTDRAIYGIFGGNLLELGEQAFRMDEFLMEMAGDHERVHAFLDRLLAIHLRNLDAYLEEIAPQIDVIGFGDDLGMQDGPQMSEAMFCEYFKPRYAQMWRRVKEKAPHVKICIHSCGGIEPLLPHLIDAGLDAVNPVQITCKGMEPAHLKARFGKDLTFWGGGCDTRYCLAQGTPHEVKENVKQLVETFKPGGGFVFQQVHNLLADVPPQNIMAMYEAVRECGNY